MNFLYPSFLYALSLMIIPVIIHFFNFRRFKTQEFTQVKFLEQATKVKRRFKRVRDLIIMLLRMLAIACLVLAFAHPIPKESERAGEKQNLISVYLDNSFSMGLEGENGDLISEAKQKAEEITEAFGENTLFQLINNNLAESNRDFVEKDLFLESLESIELSPLGLSETEIDKLQTTELNNNNGNRISIWLTDFQKNNFDLDNLTADSSIKKFWIPMLAADAGNITIDSAWFEQALFVKGQTARLKVVVSNKSEEKIEDRSLTVKVNGGQKAIQTFSLEAEESKTIELFYGIDINGWNEVLVTTDDFPIEFDNQIYTTYFVADGNNVLSLYDDKANPFVKLVYSKDNDFVFDQKEITQLAANQLPEFDLVILEGVNDIGSGTIEALLDFVNSGGNLLFFPTEKMNKDAYDSYFNRLGISFNDYTVENSSVRDLDLNNFFFKDIFDEIPKNTDYPKAFQFFKSNLSTRSKTNALITLSNGFPYLYETNIGQGKVFTFTAPISEKASSIVRNGVFLPFMYKFASYKGGQSSNAFFIDQKPTTVRVGNGVVSKVVSLTLDDYAFVPNHVYKNGVLTVFEDEISMAGFYDVGELDNPDTTHYKLGFNFSREESDMRFWNLEELEVLSKSAGAKIINLKNTSVTGTLKDISDKNRFWRYLLMAAFCFILFEIIAIKLPFK